MSSAAVWYAARGAGIVAYLLLTATVVLGVGLAGRRVRILPRFALEDIHRYLGLLTGVFLSIHIAGILLDSVVPFSLPQVVVPFTAGYRPVWTGLGVVALELLVALAITNKLRRRLSYRLWRVLHGGSFVVWGLATVHGALSGTDRDTTWGRVLFAGAVAAVASATVIRLARRHAPAAALPAGLGLGAVAAAAVVGLSSVHLPAPDARSGVTPDVPLMLSAPFRATVSERDGASAILVSVAGITDAADATAMRIDLLRTTAGVDAALQLEFPGGVGCTGDVTALDDSGFTGSCTTPQGSTRSVTGRWAVDGTQIRGTIDVSAGSERSTLAEA